MNRRFDDAQHEAESLGHIRTQVGRTPSATPGMQAFHRIETVDEQPLITTVGLFITDETWERIGQPELMWVTMEAAR